MRPSPHSKKATGLHSGYPDILRKGAVAALAGALALGSALDAPAQLRADEDPIDNPDLEQACGLNVLMILDESGSIGNNDDNVRDAFKAFTAAIKNTSSSMAVAEFSRVARLPGIGPFDPGTYVTVTDQTKVFLDEYVDNDYDPGGNTNWEDGLRMGRSGSAFAPRPDFNVPHLTVFITDGDPTRVIRGDRVTADEYLNKVPLNDNETTDRDKNPAADAAVANANNLKSQGSHILVIAVGNGVSSNASLNRIQKISGPDVYPDDGGEFDISTDDVYREQDFSRLAEALREAAFQLCSPSVTIAKQIDLTPDPGSLDDSLPGPGWEIQGSVNAPGNGEFAWILPLREDPGTNPQSTLTNDGGFATFQWRPADEVGPSGFTATETIQPGFQNDRSQTRCTFRTPDQPEDQPLNLTAVGNGTFSTLIEPESIVTCVFVNIADPAPAITLEKFTDGDDADTPTGPVIPRGEQVTWNYIVQNAGNTRLDNVAIEDVVELPAAFAGQQQPFITCPKTSLVQGETMTCTALGVSGVTPDGNNFNGQYANLATVTATDSTGLPVSASDRSHYFEVEPGINVEKETNSRDADRQPGPLVRVNSTVVWRYVVTNTGSEPLANIVLVDDDPGVTPVFQGGDLDNDGLLDLDETWLYEATGLAVSGQYANRATVTGDGANESVSDQDPSHYFGAAPAIAVEKATNTLDADLPPGPLIPAGELVSWTYVVTNTGNVDLGTWGVTDDQQGPVTCPAVVLRVGESATCGAQFIAVPGQYVNVATARATSPAGGPDVTATDPSHYFGTVPGLALEKSTNGVDADAPTGPFIPVGDPVNWTYEVTNTGNVTVNLAGVLDSELPLAGVNCGSGNPLLPGDSVTCTASDVATPGQYSNLGIAVGRPVNVMPGNPLGNVFATDPSHYFGADPGVSIEKFTNGVDADTPAQAIRLQVGSVVEWGYLVGNTGNEPLENVQVADDQGVVPVLTGGDDNGNGLLDIGEYWLFEAPGVAQANLYANIGSVTALDSLGQTVSDTDPSHYLGIVNDLVIEKSTNGVDADLPPGPQLAVGAPVTWEYLVTNNGNASLQNLSVTDDQGVTPVFVDGDTNNDDILDPGETWRFTAQGSAIAGQYANLATATAISVDDGGLTEEVSSEDPSHYFGGDSLPAIDIEKFTNGEDADVAPGPLLEAGSAVSFSYRVTNSGNVALSNVLVVDDQGVTVTCQGGNPIPSLPVGSVGNCSASSTVVAGQYMNIGTATGSDVFNQQVQDTDPSHHFGFVAGGAGQSAVELEKATNGQDADLPPGPALQPGDAVSFSYVVTNTGDVPLADVSITDDQGVTVVCPSGNPIPLLTAGASETCTGGGIVTIGQYANLGSVAAIDPDGNVVTDDDPSHHLGASPGIAIEKATNGVDADTPQEAVQLLTGSTVTWTYVVTNIGNEPLDNVQVTDDQGVVPVLVSGDANNDGVLDLDETWTFEATGTAAAGDYTNTGTVEGTDALANTVNDSDPSHYFGISNDLALEKSTNGVDADQAPGPQLAIGSPVTWEYLATNTGNAPLRDINVLDDQGVVPVFVDGDLNSNGLLDPGEAWRYRAIGTAAAGQYANLGTVLATSVDDEGMSETLEARDPSHYFGGANTPAISIEKLTNGEDADLAPGPLLLIGSDAVFFYAVFNTGNVALQDVLVTDDQGLTPQCLGGNPIPVIEPDGFGLCVASTSVTQGQYRNIGTVTATDTFGTAVSATDPSHHFGFEVAGLPVPSVDIEKATNGADADTPPGPGIEVGGTARFTYVVTNTGGTPLRNLLVTDDRGVVVTCPSGNPIPLLAIGARETCTGATRVREGEYRNLGTVTGEGPGGEPVSDSDPSHHRGFIAAIPTLPGLGLALLALLIGGLGMRAAARRKARN